MKKETEDLIVVGVYDKPMDAYLAQSYLKNHGLESFVHDEHIGSHPHFSIGLSGGVKLRVLESDVESAKHLLDEVARKPILLDDELAEGIPCPKCQSLKTEIVGMAGGGWFFNVLSVLFFLIPIRFMQKEKWRCLDCGHEWREKKSYQMTEKITTWVLFLILLYFFIHYLMLLKKSI